MTRNEAREHWAAAGLTYGVLTKDSLEKLRSRIDAELRASGLIKNYRAAKTAKLWVSAGDTVADIRCHAHYFKDRQAVTFERDGFVGFAGWADDTNVQPILAAFTAWVDEIRK